MKCETKFLRYDVRPDYAQADAKFCFECAVEVITGERDVIAFARHFDRHPEIEHAFMVRGNDGEYRYIVRGFPATASQFLIMSRQEFEDQFL